MADVRTIFPKKSSGSRASCCIAGVRIGKIALIDECGEIRVDFPGNDLGPVKARLTSSAKEKLRRAVPVGWDVLLVFDEGDPCRPVVVDTLYARLDDITEESITQAQRPDEVLMDGKRVIFDAEHEIVLRCGEASITLTSAGKIVLKGSYLTSRSSGANRIKGGSVQIN